MKHILFLYLFMKEKRQDPQNRDLQIFPKKKAKLETLSKPKLAISRLRPNFAKESKM